MIAARLLLALCVVSGTAGIATADDAALRAARRHFERGEQLYGLTRFEEALAAYQRAFDAKPIAEFMFNIGQCHRNLGDYEAAVFSFRRYLELAPAASNRAQVERLIEELEAEQARGHSRRLRLVRPVDDPAGDPPPVAEAPARPIYQRWWFWAGAAAIAGGVGGTVYLMTRGGDPPPTQLGNIDFGR